MTLECDENEKESDSEVEYEDKIRQVLETMVGEKTGKEENIALR